AFAAKLKNDTARRKVIKLEKCIPLYSTIASRKPVTGYGRMLLLHSDRAPHPGGFSRNGVEKVWPHRSFLATLECVDAVTSGSRQKRLCRRCDLAVAPHGEGPPHTIYKIFSSRDGRQSEPSGRINGQVPLPGCAERLRNAPVHAA